MLLLCCYLGIYSSLAAAILEFLWSIESLFSVLMRYDLSTLFVIVSILSLVAEVSCVPLWPLWRDGLFPKFRFLITGTLFVADDR